MKQVASGGMVCGRVGQEPVQGVALCNTTQGLATILLRLLLCCCVAPRRRQRRYLAGPAVDVCLTYDGEERASAERRRCASGAKESVEDGTKAGGQASVCAEDCGRRGGNTSWQSRQ